MSDNVIILGAGASSDAGIPLLGNFIDKMIEINAKGVGPRGKISQSDKLTIEKALEVISSIENFHARVSINQFNIEELLSVILFKSEAGVNGSKKDLDNFKKAIAATIEICCSTTYDESTESAKVSGCKVYNEFWKGFFAGYKAPSSKLPTIISFNYDLVLERSLIQFFEEESNYEQISFMKIDGFRINYGSSQLKSKVYEIKEKINTRLVKPKIGFSVHDSYSLEKNPFSLILEINLLKLHGSLNFGSGTNNIQLSLTNPCDKPYIIPPVFNKSDKTFSSATWKAALQYLSIARNIIFCGYSLPSTDIYMQYFIKAALGGNKNLNQITVFDPEIFNESEKGKFLQQRYSECFSRQYQNKIIFRPQMATGFKSKIGEFFHLVETLINSPKDILFL